MAKDPNDRPQSAKDALDMLSRISGIEGDGYVTGTGSTEFSSRHRRQRTRKRKSVVPMIVLGILLLCLVGIGAVMYLNKDAAWKDLQNRVGGAVRLDSFSARSPNSTTSS